MKTYVKTLLRAFTNHISRFISLTLIVLVSVGFISGLGTVTDKIEHSLAAYYRDRSVSDFIVKSTKSEGFTDEDLSALEKLFPGAKIDVGNSFDVPIEIAGKERLTRLSFLDGARTVNLLDVREAREGATVYAEEGDNRIADVAIGTRIELDFSKILSDLAEQGGEPLDPAYAALLGNLEPVEITVEGKVVGPLTFALDGEPSYIQDEEDYEIPDMINAVNEMNLIEAILYLPADLIPKMSDILPILPDDPILPNGDFYVAVADRSLFQPFGEKYESFVGNAEEQIRAALSDESGSYAEVITLYRNFSFKSLSSYAEKVEAIGLVLMIAFLAVTALVVLSTMTRLMEEERAQIACLKTLGYSPARIVFKYLLFALLATGVGGFAAYFVAIGLADLLYYVFNFSFVMPPISDYIPVWFYLVIYFSIVIATLVVTAIAGGRMANEKPAVLLRPKPPRAGKKVILERIPFLWNRLSFKYKSTLRNVLRYKNRFFMTVAAVACSMALVMAGLGLLDLCLFGSLNSPSIAAVAVVVIAFAGMLTATIVYTLTNINVSERNRELATLMVLGYFNGEVTGYIYREIYIDTAIGVVFGYPLSALLVGVAFKVIGLGTLGGISWFFWLCAPLLVFLFTAIVTLMLRQRIVGIDMNESLKASE